MNEEFEISLSVKPKVGLLYSYLKDNNLTIKQLAEIVGVTESWLCGVINFTYVPKSDQGQGTQKLLKFFGVGFSDIFPSAKLKLIAGERQVSRSIPKDKLANWSREQFDELPAPQIDSRPKEINMAIMSALDKLNGRDKEILILRYGLDGKDEHSHGEIGKIFGVTRERIRQIESRALRKLRHPLRSKDLKLAIQT